MLTGTVAGLLDTALSIKMEKMSDAMIKAIKRGQFNMCCDLVVSGVVGSN